MSKGICLQCDGFIESKSRHDFVRCDCGASFLDGGNDYSRGGGYVSIVPDHVMTAEEFWEYLDELEKQMEEEESGKE